VSPPVSSILCDMADDDIGFPAGDPDEKELLLQWLGYLRRAVARNLDGLNDEQSLWTPDDRLISLLGIVNHLTRVEWRWIDGGFGGADVSRADSEFTPRADLGVDAALAAYRARAAATDAAIRSMTLDQISEPAGWAEGHELRWVVLHLINETARHCGHADATRELLDGTTGE
jgi:uncharacterized damage-inducible protein DinB